MAAGRKPCREGRRRLTAGQYQLLDSAVQACRSSKDPADLSNGPRKLIRTGQHHLTALAHRPTAQAGRDPEKSPAGCVLAHNPLLAEKLLGFTNPSTEFGRRPPPMGAPR
jgi:hypothetical protein